MKYLKTTRQYGKKADLALSMWVKLARAFSTFNKQTVEDIRLYGLTQPQFSILESLGHLGPMTLSGLSRKQLASCGNTTVVVDNLEKEGLVTRKPCAEDRRSIYVHLTPKGKKLFNEVFHQHARCVAKLASVLSDAEQKQLSLLLKKLGLALRESADKDDGKEPG
ncbi:MAG: MarR family transcriptional regulator [Bacteroidota bacterium]